MNTNAQLIIMTTLGATLVCQLVHTQNMAPSSDFLVTTVFDASQPDGARHGKHKGRPDQVGKGKKHGPKSKMGSLTPLTTLSGTVGQLLGNDEYILDGFTLNVSGATTTVKFPAHLGQQIQQAIKPGSSVSISGYSDTRPQGESRFHLHSLTAGETTVFDTKPVRNTTPQTPTLTSVTGEIADYRLNRKGQLSGLVLEDKTVVTIPAHVAYQLTELAKKGNAITVQGYPKILRDGQVQLENVNVVQASMLTIDGRHYLVR